MSRFQWRRLSTICVKILLAVPMFDRLRSHDNIRCWTPRWKYIFAIWRIVSVRWCSPCCDYLWIIQNIYYIHKMNNEFAMLASILDGFLSVLFIICIMPVLALPVCRAHTPNPQKTRTLSDSKYKSSYKRHMTKKIHFDKVTYVSPMMSCLHPFNLIKYNLWKCSYTFAHSSAKWHSFLLSFSGATPWFNRYSLCALRHACSNSVNSVRFWRGWDVLADLPLRNAGEPLFIWFSLASRSNFVFKLLEETHRDSRGEISRLVVFERRKRCALGDFCTSDSGISNFSLITTVRSGLWPLYVWIVSNERNSNWGSCRMYRNVLLN